jgi:hypothetical protein
MKINLIFQIL